MKNNLVLVVCGAGTLTSVVASQGIHDGLKKMGIKNPNIVTGKIEDISRYKERISVLVTTMNVREKHDFQVLNAISFLTGDEMAQEQLIKKVFEILNEGEEK